MIMKPATGITAVTRDSKGDPMGVRRRIGSLVYAPVPGGPPAKAASLFSSGISATRASVVSRSDAMEPVLKRRADDLGRQP